MVRFILKSYGIKNYSKLTKTTIVDKNGHTRTVYKKNRIENVAKKTKKPENNDMRIRRGLKKTDEIADYLESRLKKMGYDIERDYSGLSGSRYITITNYNDITGKESRYNDNELKIRISDHDLPPSYDGLHGFHDFDVMSGNNSRPGNDGLATKYDEVIKKLESEIKESVKNEQKETIKKENRELKEKSSILPSWFTGKKSVEEKMNSTDDFETKFLLKRILTGEMSGHKKPTEKQLKEIFINIYEQMKNDEELKKMYKDL